MNPKLKIALAVSALVLGAQAMAQVTFYEGEGYRGRAFTTQTEVANFARMGFNDRASSVVVDKGRWEVCEDARFGGRCSLLRPGSYDSLRAMGMENSISSVRPARNRRADIEAPTPQPVANYEYRRRANERVYEAPVTQVRAVMGAATERCWVERQQVQQSDSGRNVGGTIAGALIGGILGHQVGGGSGKDLATVGGAVAGGVIGSNVAGNGQMGSRDVRRCENTTSGTPAYWDVTYNFRGRDHNLQMSAAPGATIAVNGRGEPRQ
ncbi:MAG: beta/gamma crystallin-related protein [Pseudomonadota bacterium]